MTGNAAAPRVHAAARLAASGDFLGRTCLMLWVTLSPPTSPSELFIGGDVRPAPPTPPHGSYQHTMAGRVQGGCTRNYPVKPTSHFCFGHQLLGSPSGRANPKPLFIPNRCGYQLKREPSDYHLFTYTSFCEAGSVWSSESVNSKR